MGLEGDEKSSRNMYTGKYILAPMVRIGTLPTRLMALRYGADLVYSEEIIDFKMLKTRRIVNKILQTVDFVLPDGTVVFRTCEEERNRVVFQMGTSDPERALKTAQHVEQDVVAIDVNMGCPKDYSIKGGMGAALLTQPDKIYKILTTLVKGINKPVTCKIRILPALEESLQLARLIESTGVAAVAVHGREKHERSREPVHNEVLSAIAEELTIPVIANGGSLEINTFDEMENYRHLTHCTSVMVARAAQWNLSIFRKEGLLPKIEVLKEYIKTAIDCDNNFSNSKYCALTLLHEEHTTPIARKITATKDMQELCDAVALLSYYKDCCRNRSAQKLAMDDKSPEPKCTVVKRKLSDSEFYDVLEMKIKFLRSNYSATSSPKAILTHMTRKKKVKAPHYNTVIEEETKAFRSTVTVENKSYSSTEWEKSKKYAEQAAAIVCLRALGIHDGRLKEEEP